jgi:hypothetical protein
MSDHDPGANDRQIDDLIRGPSSASEGGAEAPPVATHAALTVFTHWREQAENAHAAIRDRTGFVLSRAL